MPLKFAYLCDLLQRLENLELQDRDVRLLREVKEERYRKIVCEWFHSHRGLIDSPDSNRVALLSSLFPEKRTDRVYWLQSAGLLKVLCRCLGLGTERLQRLQSWKPSNREDLASWATNIVKVTDAGMAACNLTLNEIDQTLDKVAATCKFSSPQVRSRWPKASTGTAHVLLKPLIHQLPSRELKWFLRLVLKNFQPVVLDEVLVLRQVHFLLPKILKFQSNFDAATAALNLPSVRGVPARPDARLEELLMAGVGADCFRPHLGVKISQPNFLKARSLHQCLKLVKNGRWAVEPKIDGEYCQVHIDLSKGEQCIQLFAKSGKDATNDRLGLHEGIRQSLRLGDADCRFKRQCILEGEMVVYNEKTASISEFHKIRKHVTRGGSLLGAENDSQMHDRERLMLVFFDALLIDDEITMAFSYEVRRSRLKELVIHRKGYAERIEWGVVDFSTLNDFKAKRKLERLFSKAIAHRVEGIVLKPCDRPYLSLAPHPSSFGGFIKLKKDYIPGLGDTADFAVIGGSRDVSKHSVVGAKLNRFSLACIINKDAVVRFGDAPTFRVLCSLSRPCISERDILFMSTTAHCLENNLNEDDGNDIPSILTTEQDAKIEAKFRKPFIAEVLGSGFEKPTSQANYMLRHPRIVKIHGDRGLEDVVSFEELQDMAHEAIKVPNDTLLEESKLQLAMKQACQPKRREYITDWSPFTNSTSKSGSSPMTTPIKVRQNRASASLIRIDSCELLPGEIRKLPSQPTFLHAADRHISAVRIMTPPPLRSSPGGTTHSAIHAESRCFEKFPRPISTTKRKRENEPASREGTFPVARNLQERPSMPSSFDRQLWSQKSPKIPPLVEITNALSNQSTLNKSHTSREQVENFDSALSHEKDSYALSSAQESLASFHSAISQKPPELKNARLWEPRTTAPQVAEPPPKSDNTTSSSSSKTAGAASRRIPAGAHESKDAQTRLTGLEPRKSHLLRHCTVYISPCIQKTSYLIESLLPILSPADVTASLSYWKRDLLYLPPSARIVSESQACSEMQKIVLVEAKRRKRTRDVIKHLEQIKLGVGERIEVWDWRMAESLAELLGLERDREDRETSKLPSTATVRPLQACSRTAEQEGEQRRTTLLRAIAACYLGYVGWKDENGRNGWFSADNEAKHLMAEKIIHSFESSGLLIEDMKITSTR